MLAITCVGLIAASATAGSAQEFRVCSDPNNLPFSDKDETGFENRIARMFANDLGRKLEYTWRAHRRGFLRNTLYARECDIVMGVPSSLESVLVTRPYYRASYVFVTREDSGLEVNSFDDPVLRQVHVGVHLIGDDYSNTPPAHALAKRGIIENVTGFMIYGDYGRPKPTADLIKSLASGNIDLAIAWGPQARYFASRMDTPLRLKPVQPVIDRDGMTFTYAISMGVRRDDRELKSELDELLLRRKDDIKAILSDYNVVEQGD